MEGFMKKVKEFWKKIIIWRNIFYFVLFLLLGAHVFQVSTITVDSITLALLGILALAPFANYVKKIRFGDFEAEIDQKEVDIVKSKVASELGAPIDVSDEPENNEFVDLLELVERDRQLGLAKLRIEIESTLKKFMFISGIKLKGFSLHSMIDALFDKKLLHSGIVSSLRDVLPLTNRAIHGEYVDEKQAKEIVLIGISVLNEMNRLLRTNLLRPIETLAISNDESDELQVKAKYRVTTVVPLVENPYKNIYIFNQQGLDEFLFGYSHHAEFIVAVERDQ